MTVTLKCFFLYPALFDRNFTDFMKGGCTKPYHTIPGSSKSSWRLQSFVSSDLGSLHKQKSQVGGAGPAIFIAICFSGLSFSISSKLKIVSIKSGWLKESVGRVAIWRNIVKKRKISKSLEVSLVSKCYGCKNTSELVHGRAHLSYNCKEPEAALGNQLPGSNPVFLSV